MWTNATKGQPAIPFHNSAWTISILLFHGCPVHTLPGRQGWVAEKTNGKVSRFIVNPGHRTNRQLARKWHQLAPRKWAQWAMFAVDFSTWFHGMDR